MALDIRTVIVVFALCNLMMAGTLWLAFAGNFREGIGKWVAALLVQAAAYALFVANGAIPEDLSIVVSNTAFMLSLSLQAASLYEFQHRKPPLALILVPSAIIAVAFVALLPYFLARVAVGNLSYGLCTGLLACLLLQDKEASTVRGRWLMITMYAAAAATFAAHGLAGLLAPEMIGSLLDATAFQAVTVLIGLAALFLASFGFLLVHKERTDETTRRLATTDPLTGVFNRRTFIELAERELARCQRSGEPLRLLMLDLDYFKRVNDVHGHLVGDEVLAGFAHTVSGCLRRADLLVRYGGDEFCVLLPDADTGTAETLAERIRAVIDGTPLPTRAGPIHITTSIGICGEEAAMITSLDRLLACADDALYSAKRSGRNRIVSSDLSEASLALSASGSPSPPL